MSQGLRFPQMSLKALLALPLFFGLFVYVAERWIDSLSFGTFHSFDYSTVSLSFIVVGEEMKSSVSGAVVRLRIDGTVYVSDRTGADGRTFLTVTAPIYRSGSRRRSTRILSLSPWVLSVVKDGHMKFSGELGAVMDGSEYQNAITVATGGPGVVLVDRTKNRPAKHIDPDTFGAILRISGGAFNEIH